MRKAIQCLLVFAVLALNAKAQSATVNLKFDALEVMNKLKSFSFKPYDGRIRKLNNETFLLTEFDGQNSFYLVKKVKSDWVVYGYIVEDELDLENVKQVGRFLVFEYATQNAVRGNTHSSRFYVIVNPVEATFLALQTYAENESWDDSDDEKASKEVQKESCISKVKFDGLYLRVSRSYKNNCKDCIETGLYKFAKDRFVKLKK